MAEYLVQSESLTAVANKIRSKGVTSAQLVFPDEFESAIDALSYVQRTSGTFTTSSSGKATVNCGFKPDLVLMHINYYDDGYYDSISAAFTERNATKVFCAGWHDDSSNDSIFDLALTQTNTGFSVEAYTYDWDWAESNLSRKKFNYVAVKYT